MWLKANKIYPAFNSLVDARTPNVFSPDINVYFMYEKKLQTFSIFANISNDKKSDHGYLNITYFHDVALY